MTHRIGFTGYPTGGAERYYEFSLWKYDATTAPTTSNNASEGYSVGSLWFVTDGKAYTLTGFSGTDALWKLITDGLVSVDWGDIGGTLSDQTDLQSALDAKADESITITGATSLTGGGNLTANRTLSLVNDSASPGNNYYYGTNSGGTKGYHTLPTGTVTSVGVSGSTGLAVSGSPITGSGTITLTLDSDLQALSGLSSTGFVARTAANAYSERTLSATAGDLTISNGDGVSGNPTFSLANTGTAGTYGIVTTDARGRVASGASHTVSLQELSSGNYTIASSGSWLDTGCSITLGTGTWLITGSISGFIALTTGRYQIKARIATSGGTLVAGTETIFMDNGNTTIVVANGTLAQASVAGSATYKIQVWRTEFVAGTGVSTGIYGNSDGTRLSAIRIA